MRDSGACGSRINGDAHHDRLLCFLNGEYLPLAEARIPVLDRGFIFGDGIYDVVPVYGQRLFRFDEHMARLEPLAGQDPHPNPPRANSGCNAAGGWSPPAAQATGARTRWSTSRSRAAWRRATT
jgi:hypothetical protein